MKKPKKMELPPDNYPNLDPKEFKPPSIPELKTMLTEREAAIMNTLAIKDMLVELLRALKGERDQIQKQLNILISDQSKGT